MIDKRLILNELIKFYSDGKIGDFAKKIGVSQQTLSNWKSRNTFDPEIIFTKCENLSAEWLLTGEGPMIKNQLMEDQTPFEQLHNQIKELVEMMDQLNSKQNELMNKLSSVDCNNGKKCD